MFQVDLVDAGHGLKVGFIYWDGVVVNGGAGNVQQFALPGDRQVFFFVDQGPPRRDV